MEPSRCALLSKIVCCVAMTEVEEGWINFLAVYPPVESLMFDKLLEMRTVLMSLVSTIFLRIEQAEFE